MIEILTVKVECKNSREAIFELSSDLLKGMGITIEQIESNMDKNVIENAVNEFYRALAVSMENKQ